MVKNPPANAGDEIGLRSLGQEDPLEEGMATHFSILAWRIPMDRGAWQAIVHRVVELDMTEATMCCFSETWCILNLATYFRAEF